MTSIRLNQKKLINEYSNLLDYSKVPYIINILKYFYKDFNDYHTSSTDWLDNQIGFFLDPYYNKGFFFEKRRVYIKKLSKKLSNKEYSSVSLDKIILELFSWKKDELLLFYENNKSGKGDKSKYNTMKGGGSSNEYMLYYIKSLSKKNNFKKTVIIFNLLNELNSYNNFLEENFINENIFINKYTPYVNIEKLFIFLLNSNSNFLDNIIKKLNKYFIKFNISNLKNLKNLKKIKEKDIETIEFTDKIWFYTSNSYIKDSYNYNFYKLFNDQLFKITLFVRKFKNNYYIRGINVWNYKTNKIILFNDKQYKNIIYYNYFGLFNDSDKLKIKINDKKIILVVVKEFINNIQLKEILRYV
jgi:hypothetical protein